MKIRQTNGQEDERIKIKELERTPNKLSLQWWNQYYKVIGCLSVCNYLGYGKVFGFYC